MHDLIKDGQVLRSHEFGGDEVPTLSPNKGKWVPRIVTEVSFDPDTQTRELVKEITDTNTMWTYQAVDKTPEKLAGELEGAKLQAIARVNDEAEDERLKYITPGAAKMLVYNQKALEQKKGKGQSPVDVKAEYPFIEAEMRAKGEDFETVRSRIEATEAAWTPIAAEIEYKTIVAVDAIGAATTKAEVDTAANIDWGS